MSSDAAIIVDGLTKSYLRYAKPEDRLKQAVMPRLRRFVGKAEMAYFTRFWALNGVGFKVARGETVGIIGKNGSGKSTLLKLVCGTLAATDGRVETRGRVAALLELGSGFNPEFTGRENIFLNASVLGLGRAATEARLDDIIAFADIGDFVDQPVKTYSSGMAMRLAFAVMAHVDADVLIIDEALAVGDAYFQQKCLRWLRSFRERGTVLFCGHDMGAVLSFCHRAIWLDQGRVRMIGSAKDVCEAYSTFILADSMGLGADAVAMKPAASGPAEAAAPPEFADLDIPFTSPMPAPPVVERPIIFDNVDDSSRYGSGRATVERVRLTSPSGAALTWIEGGEDVLVTADIRVVDDIEAPIVGFHIKDRLGQALLGDNSFATYRERPFSCRPGDRLTARFRFRLPHLATGRYAMTVAIASGTLEHHVQHTWLHDALFFDVHSPHRNGVAIAVPMQEIAIGHERAVAALARADA